MCGFPRGAGTPSLVARFTKRPPPGVPSALGLQPQVWARFPSSRDRKTVFGGGGGSSGMVTCHHCPDRMARHSPCTLSGMGAAANTTLSLGLEDRDSNSKRFRKRPVSWWVTQVGCGPQGSCPPKGRLPTRHSARPALLTPAGWLWMGFGGPVTHRCIPRPGEVLGRARVVYRARGA